MTERNEAVRRLERILNSNFRGRETFTTNAEKSTNKNTQHNHSTKTKKAQEATKQNNREQ